MRALARFIGIVWMAGAAVLWLWLGYAQPLGSSEGGPLSNWSVLSLLADSQFGLTGAALALGGVGFGIWQWGRGKLA